jgi:Cu2+-containing amine oxidase
MFDAPTTGASDPADGIRILASGQIAQTVLDNGTDIGNFKGVAIYTQNKETVLITELQAGWYRYIMEWRFADDGTIRPRYGFGATNNSCVCIAHNHHAYWRFDFDIVNPNNKIFQVERGRKFLQPILTERFQNKNIQTNRSLLIQNSTGNEAYMLVPNLTDGVVDTFGAHDFWVLRYKSVPGGSFVQNEIDDGRFCCGGTSQGIAIDSWVNNESVANQDVVVWYGAHFIHSDGENLVSPDRSGEILTNSHVVGPDIRPIRW